MNKVFGKDAMWHQHKETDVEPMLQFETRNKFGHRGVVVEVRNYPYACVIVGKTQITYKCTSIEAGKKWASDMLDVTYLMESLNYDEFNSRTLAKDPKATLQWYAMSYAALTGDLVEMDFGACTFEVL